MESHLVRIINRLEMMAADGGNSKRNFEREGVVVAEVSFSNDPEKVQCTYCVTLKLASHTHLIAST